MSNYFLTKTEYQSLKAAWKIMEHRTAEDHILYNLLRNKPIGRGFTNIADHNYQKICSNHNNPSAGFCNAYRELSSRFIMKPKTLLYGPQVGSTDWAAYAREEERYNRYHPARGAMPFDQYLRERERKFFVDRAAFNAELTARWGIDHDLIEKALGQLPDTDFSTRYIGRVAEPRTDHFTLTIPLVRDE